MSGHVYKKVEVTGSSTESSDDAIRTAIAKAAQTIRHMDWFEVVETRGEIHNDQIAFWQVTLKIGFRLDD